MSARSGLGYAQARLQARYAELPGEDDWQRLAGARTLGSFLEEAREGALRGWVKGFSALSDAHDLDRGLRAIWNDAVDEVARWAPGPWRPAVVWLRWLPLLPMLAHANRYKDLPAWVVLDPNLQALCDSDGGLSISALSADLDPDSAAALLASHQGLAAAWQARWRAFWPDPGVGTRSRLERLAALVLDHARAFEQAGTEVAWELRRELRDRLRLEFHRSTLEPAATFAFLALTALDLERLRAALMDRALFTLHEAA